MVWAMLLVPLVGLAKLRGLVLLSLGRTFAGQFPVLVLRPGLFAVALAILWALPGRLGPTQAMAWQVVAAAAALLTVATFFLRYRPALLRSAASVSRTRRWLLAAIPMGMSEGLRLLQGQMATLLLSVLATTTAVGLFRVADSAAAICLVPITILNVVACPFFSRLHTAGNKAELQRILTAVSVATFLCVATVSLPLAVFARPLLVLAFGADFASSAPAFQILLGGNLLASALGPAVSLANMTGHEKMVTAGTGIAVVTVTLGSLLLARGFGATGGALAVAVAMTVWTGILATVVRLRLGLDSTIFSLEIKDMATVAKMIRNLFIATGRGNGRTII
jgi:O-antigen/teichoic acid export membrane protein